jgi:hypothetical protein
MPTHIITTSKKLDPLISRLHKFTTHVSMSMGTSLFTERIISDKYIILKSNLEFKPIDWFYPQRTILLAFFNAAPIASDIKKKM